MDFDDQRDYMDQDIPAGNSGKFLTAQSGPTAQFLEWNGMPDWIHMTPEDTRRHQPGSGEPPQSLRRTYYIRKITLEVNEWHHIHGRHY